MFFEFSLGAPLKNGKIIGAPQNGKIFTENLEFFFLKQSRAAARHTVTTIKGVFPPYSILSLDLGRQKLKKVVMLTRDDVVGFLEKVCRRSDFGGKNAKIKTSDLQSNGKTKKSDLRRRRSIFLKKLGNLRKKRRPFCMGDSHAVRERLVHGGEAVQ